MSLDKLLSSFFTPLATVFQRWAAKRRPKGKKIELNQKRIFIFPTLAGWLYFVVCIALFLIATNYQNNLIHAISFLLISLGVLTIHYTFLNLSGLIVTAVDGRNCHMGELAEFTLILRANNLRRYESINVSFKGESDSSKVYLVEEREKKVRIATLALTRGDFSPPAIKIETVYPLGLLRAWSWIELELGSIIYPKIEQGRLPHSIEGDLDEGRGKNNRGDDFSGLSEYIPGASLRHIAWKHYAQGRGLLTKDYVGQENRQLWLSWDDWAELPSEKRLSVMTYWALEFEFQGVEYGLALPEVVLSPSNGPQHLKTVLTVLARFELRGRL
jgi:uncharacterized protein (DUF58 family)